ncbi:hypothetical protein F443_04189 [Phytophthora nicotianae P1569]|uniref:Uncharacterized protein n=1 Tax=Phytophthora nicotianae P1569 TaxID=1317065 RepID=V9FNW6_PHYNI|nr:hypothetical protein F443_04189 [Phytophthora nicotianae P1569]
MQDIMQLSSVGAYVVSWQKPGSQVSRAFQEQSQFHLASVVLGSTWHYQFAIHPLTVPDIPAIHGSPSNIATRPHAQIDWTCFVAIFAEERRRGGALVFGS